MSRLPSKILSAAENKVNMENRKATINAARELAKGALTNKKAAETAHNKLLKDNAAAVKAMMKTQKTAEKASKKALDAAVKIADKAVADVNKLVGTKPAAPVNTASNGAAAQA